MDPLSNNAPVRIGQLVGAFGLKGEMKVEPLTDFWERFQKGARLRLRGDWVTVLSYREHKNRPLIRVTGIDDIGAAEKLQWEYLEAIIEERPELDEDEYYSDDLVGMRVVSTEGQEIGIVDEIFSTPAHDVLQIGETMIPAVKEFIVSVDMESEVITVRLIPGMLAGDPGIVIDN